MRRREMVGCLGGVPSVGIVSKLDIYGHNVVHTVRNNASHCVIWHFSLGNTWHELAAPLWVLSAVIPI